MVFSCFRLFFPPLEVPRRRSTWETVAAGMFFSGSGEQHQPAAAALLLPDALWPGSHSFRALEKPFGTYLASDLWLK